MIKIYKENDLFFLTNKFYLEYANRISNKVKDKKCLIIENDCKPFKLALIAAKENDYYYSLNLLKKIIYRENFSSLFENTIQTAKTKKIEKINDIDFEPFIIKPITSSHFKNIITNDKVDFSFQIFKSKKDFLNQYNEDYISKHLKYNYIIQECSLDNRLVRLAGVTNSNSDVYFQRTSISVISDIIERQNKYLNDNQISCIRTFKDDLFENEKHQIQNFMKKHNVRCAPFTIEFVKINNVYKLIDYSYNFSPFMNRCLFEKNPIEIIHALNYMFDLTDFKYTDNKDFFVHSNKIITI